MGVKQIFQHQFKKLIPFLFKLYIPILILLCLVIYAASKTHIPIANFTRDPAAVANMQPFTGIISNLGILGWCSTATVCFCSSIIARRRVGGQFLASFFFSSGVITSILLLDDLFLFHETVIPDLLLIRQEMIYAIYFFMILYYLIKFRKSIYNTDFLLLFTAFFFFGLSILIDLSPLTEAYILEDGFKLLGITTWAAYMMRSCFTLVESLPSVVNKNIPLKQPLKSANVTH